MKNYIELTTDIAIETYYDKQPSIFNANARPDTKAIQTAKETLSPSAFSVYNTLCSFKNRAFITTSVESFAQQLNLSFDEFNHAAAELINHKYLNYTQLSRGDKTYIGNAFAFIPDNSIVAVVPAGYVAETDEEYKRLVEAWKKPHFFTGKLNTSKEVF